MSQTAPPDRDTPSGDDDRKADATAQTPPRHWKQAVAAVTSTVADAAVDAVTIVGDAARSIAPGQRPDESAGSNPPTGARRNGGSRRSRPSTTAKGSERASGNGRTTLATSAAAAAARSRDEATTGGTRPQKAPTTPGPPTGNGAVTTSAAAGATAAPARGKAATTTTPTGNGEATNGEATGTARRPASAGATVAAPPAPATPPVERPVLRQRPRPDTSETAWLPPLRQRTRNRPWLVRAVGFATVSVAGLAMILVAAAALLPRAMIYAAGAADAELILPDDTVFDPLAQRSRVLYADGSLLAILHGEEDRKPVRLDRMPDHAWQAIVAAEDRKFFDHEGYDPAGIGRALLANFQAGGIEQGGSTISQQVARLNFKEVGLEQSITRKVKEVAYAVALEERFTKEQILDRYVNQVYFGAGAYGLQAASQEFFDTNVAKITPDQAALLAGLISSPSRYHPRANPEQALQQRDLVLNSMAEAGYLTEAEAAEYMELPLEIAPPPKGTNKQPAILEEVMREFNANPLFGATLEEREDNLFNGGLRIMTTIRPRLQRLAQQTVESYYSGSGPTAAIAAVDPRTGAIKAAASSRKNDKDNFSLALRGRRQPGSAFKPFVMAEALRQGFSPGTTLKGKSPMVFPQRYGPSWSVQNYGNASYGQLDMAEATKKSVNTYYAQLIQLVGVERAVRMAEKLGISREGIGEAGFYGPAIVLGGMNKGATPVEMASAYATFANNGVHIEPYLIARVKRGKKDLLDREPHKRQVLKPSVNATALRILQGPPSSGGTAPIASLSSWPVAGKTGTTQEATDAWFVGTTPVLSTAVWVGYPKAQVRMYGATGGGTAAPLWRRFMDGALEGRNPRSFPSVSEAEFVGRTVNVPNVIGLSEQDALAKLAKAKLIGRAQYQASAAAVGSVIWASPSDEAQLGTTVYVGVSTGEPPPPPEPDKPSENTKKKKRSKPNSGN